ncbi:MAG: hypothetical protein GF331_23205 [Chitinivibrionales bacterium]|nr:hypothetical protein [Chitinivibrionales bacterium]
MPLTRILAGGNPLSNLEPFEEDPPERLVFDTIVGRPGYADTVIARWERSGHARSARLSKLAIAYRRGDTAALRRLAVQHQGHRYVYVPGVALTFDEAMEAAARFGGHLVSVETAEEYQLALRLLPLRRAAWLGIDLEAKPMRWLTGEPLTFDHFFSLSDRTAAEPKYMNNFARNDAPWFAAVRGTELSGLIVEWDD